MTGFPRFWLSQPHYAAGFAIAFCITFTVLTGQYLVFVPLAVLAAGADMDMARRQWRRRQAVLKKYEPPQPWQPGE